MTINLYDERTDDRPVGDRAVVASERQHVLDALALIESSGERRFRRLGRLAKQLFDVDAVSVNLNGRGHLSADGRTLPNDTDEQREGFCDTAKHVSQPLIVPDAREDERFRNLPIVVGPPYARFYAGHPLMSPTGERMGTLCMTDSSPRDFSSDELAQLRDLARVVEKELAVGQDLDRASDVQRSLLPKALETVPGYEFAGACVPAYKVGGDFFDWYPVGDDVVFTLADVMGKGIGAAIIAASVRAVLRTASRFQDIDAAVEAASAALETDLETSGSFVTLLHARLASATGRIRYIDAGHGLCLHVRADGTTVRLASDAMPLGLGFDESWPEGQVTLGVGDLFVALSDGVLDVFDGTLAALDQVETIARRAGTAQEVVDAVRARVDASVADDVTVVAIRRSA